MYYYRKVNLFLAKKNRRKKSLADSSKPCFPPSESGDIFASVVNDEEDSWQLFGANSQLCNEEFQNNQVVLRDVIKPSLIFRQATHELWQLSIGGFKEGSSPPWLCSILVMRIEHWYCGSAILLDVQNWKIIACFEP